MAKKQSRSKPEVVGFLGVGLDAKDGHQRLTKSDHFLIVGGSEETHERMQETAIKFDEGLDRKGKHLREITIEEVMDLFHEAED